jgi:hypothetical protein
VARQRPSADRLRRFAEEHLLYEAGMLYIALTAATPLAFGTDIEEERPGVTACH